MQHFQSYLSEEDARKVLARHQKEIAERIHILMQEHYWEDDSVEYEIVISKGFTELKNRMHDPDVLAKKEAAEKWCVNATDYAAKHEGKPWIYRLIAHDTIAENMCIDHLGK